MHADEDVGNVHDTKDRRPRSDGNFFLNKRSPSQEKLSEEVLLDRIRKKKIISKQEEEEEISSSVKNKNKNQKKQLKQKKKYIC